MLKLPLRSVLAVASLLTLAVGAVAAEPAEEQPQSQPDLLQQVRQAYADTQQYQATVKFTLTHQQDRVKNIQQMDLYVVFDRPGQRLVVDKPDMRVVAGGGHLKMITEQVPNHYLDAPIDDPLTWQSLIQAMPMAFDPPLPDVVFLVAGDLNETLGPLKMGDKPDTFTAQSQEGLMTLHVDPKMHLIDHVEVALDAHAMGAPADSTLTLSYDFDIEKHNQPLEDEAFVFVPGSAQPVGTLQELIQAAQSASGGNGGTPEQHELEDQPAPSIETTTSDGKPFKLSDVKDKVIVLDFWATWCGPCRAALPHIQAVSDWARDNNKSVAVYTVNVGETSDEANAMWKQAGFTMPILMDQDNQISAAYGVQGIPQTVIIADGKVLHVHVGFDPNAEKALKDEINAALGEGEAAQ